MSVISSVLKWPDGLTTDMHMLKLDKARAEKGKKEEKAEPTTPAFTGTPSSAPAPDSSAATQNAARKFADFEVSCKSAPCILP